MLRNLGSLDKCRILQGEVGVHSCRMTLDSGTDYTDVRADLFRYLTTRAEAAMWMTIMGCPHEVLLGNDLDDLYRLAHGNPGPNIKVVTRSKARKQNEQEELDKTLDARDGAQPVLCVLGDQSSPSDSPSEHSDCQDPKDSIMNDRVYEEGSAERGSKRRR